MAAIMVSAATGVMKPLLGKLATLMGEEFTKLKNLRKEVKFISDELTGIKDALEGLAYLDELDPQTKRWRDIVREMSYDIEDIIDDFIRRIGEKSTTDGFGAKTARLLRKLRARRQIAGQIKEIKKLVLETSARRERYQLPIRPSSNVAIDPRVTTLYEKAANLVGMEGPKNELVNLLGDEENQLKVVSIVGFGGLGKTTLANEVYRRLESDFDCGAFVTVSRKPDIPKLMHSLLSEFGSGRSFDGCDLNVLLKKVNEYLQHKRYLVIIDDIWNEQIWDFIKCAFPENGLGSRVIVTTRIQDVAKACRSSGLDHILEMKPLNSEDSRKLFLDRIFGSEEPCPLHLRDVSVKILKKCGGLPLAIVSISSMLASGGSNQTERWEHVVNCLGSETNITLKRMRQILNLSYSDLPPHLKTCLLYLGMYPEDYKIERSDLERQWMAEDFIIKENGQDVEKVARNYFNELVNRSLIQAVEFDNQGSVTECRVHDMILDLIILKSAEENFFTMVDDPQAFSELEYKPRRLSIRLGKDGAKNGRTILPGNTSLSQFRSVMFFGGRENNAPPLSQFKFLRVLFIDLSYGSTVDLTGLCQLYELRYLFIMRFCSYHLPPKISALQHLETLDLIGHGSLPSDIVHLPRLMYLITGNRFIHGIANLKSLRHLYLFDLDMYKVDDIKSLAELTNLRDLILECNLPSGDDGKRRMDALCSSLGNLCSLEYLFINNGGCIDDLMTLSPPSTPYRLEMIVLTPSCRFSRVPSWMGELCNLRVLECHVDQLVNDDIRILAKLPALTHLDMNIRKATSEMIIIYGRGAFPALKCFKLILSSAPYLTFQAGSMRKLQRLELEFSVHISEQNVIEPDGIENLSALQEFSAQIGCKGAQESDKTSIESALRTAMTLHPSHPHIRIKVQCFDI